MIARFCGREVAVVRGAPVRGARVEVRAHPDAIEESLRHLDGRARSVHAVHGELDARRPRVDDHGRVVTGGQAGDERSDEPGARIHRHNARAVVLSPGVGKEPPTLKAMLEREVDGRAMRLN